MTRKTLPRKLSDGIVLALKDLEKAERDPRYSVHMGHWHTAWGGTCQVCLAGSVMAFSLGAAPTEDRLPGLYRSTRCKLEALDLVRRGYVSYAAMDWDAAAYLANKEAVDKLDRVVTDYHDNRAQWKRDMRRIAKQLAEIGL